MIKLLEQKIELRGLGARVSSLYKTYKDYPEIASFYKTENGYLCNLSGSVILDGELDSEELLEFCRVFSVKNVSGVYGQWCKRFLEANVAISDVLSLTNPKFEKSLEMNFYPERREVFNILSEHSELGEALFWISDIAKRQSSGTALIATYKQVATAGAYFIDGKTAIISAVAVKKGYEGIGYGKAVVRGLIAELSEICEEFIVVASDENTSKFYQSIGFVKCAEHAYISL